VEERFTEAAGALPGSFVERKRRTVAFHHRKAPHDDGEAAAASLAEWARGIPEVVVTVGKKVVEAAVDSVHKGDAIDSLRTDLPEGPVVFLGDDTTDEHAFRALQEGDVGVKVGPGTTAADYRVADIGDVVEVLAVLAGAAARR
ncbi:MAG: trehalose-phosphatase, partial [Acidimicrobiia bacterium]|nr:trehalose-phosphatase [Acidimicrobiia bacterium]